MGDAIAEDPNKIGVKTLNYPRTARIISDGTVYIKEHSANGKHWEEADDSTAASSFMLGDTISVQWA